VAVLLAGGTGLAQVPGGSPGTGVSAAFMKLFSAYPAWTAKVEVQVLDAAQRETVRMPVEWAVLDGKARLEVDMEQMKSKDIPAGTIAGWKQAGMSRVVSVFRPDKKTTYVLYPGVQTYMNLPLPPAEAEALEKGLKVEKTALGKETVDGHPCLKTRVVVKGDKGPLLEATVWNATDLKDFPVQVEMKEKKSAVRMRFSQVRFVKPEAGQFDVPAKYSLMK
jgi:hypothetical protein